jgi:radical SAM protein (TIGR01212 family)
MMQTTSKRYYDFNTYLRDRFGCRVQKITIDAGLTCPNRDGLLARGGCVYCNAKGSGTGAYAQGFSVTQQLLRGKQALARRYKAKKFLAYFQSFSNTYAPLEHLKRLYAEALAVADVVGLSIGTRPDCVSEAVLNLLEGYTQEYLIWVEYGLQSAHDRTLQRINRGHDVACFQRTVAATRNRGIQICAHVILGLPGESKQDMLATAAFLRDLNLDGIKIHVLYVIKGTPLEDLYRKGRYRCLEQTEYIDLVCDFLERLPPGMVIQRLTGDPHPAELVAPEWTLQKRANLDLIYAQLEKRDTWQGKRAGVEPVTPRVFKRPHGPA